MTQIYLILTFLVMVCQGAPSYHERRPSPEEIAKWEAVLGISPFYSGPRIRSMVHEREREVDPSLLGELETVRAKRQSNNIRARSYHERRPSREEMAAWEAALGFTPFENELGIRSRVHELESKVDPTLLDELQSVRAKRQSNNNVRARSYHERRPSREEIAEWEAALGFTPFENELGIRSRFHELESKVDPTLLDELQSVRAKRQSSGKI
ncbi:hypothetical protein C0J52_01777 [Blattella germanica]|nr:hypothetical protein C0J52_01777 [Blattella germanica]